MRHRRCLILLALPVVLAGGLPARDDPPRLSSAASHEHTPLEIDGAPIVARVEMPLERPRCLWLDPDSNLYVVDSAAGRVVRRSPDGRITTVADDLDQPAGIAADASGTLFVANHAGGRERRGSIVRVPAKGRPTVFVDGLTGPQGLAFDRRGVLYVALFDADQIATVDRAGRLQILLPDIEAPAALAFDPDGNLLVVSSVPGTLTRITPELDVTVLARDLEFPTGIAVDSRGRAIIANYAGDVLTALAAGGEAGGDVRPFAPVPPGTIGLVLDADDNLYLANRDFRFVLRMTLHLSVPCPHCQVQIPVRIRPRVDGMPRNVF